eukprot:GHVU01234040.1.p1 GENE.GHVU01234040.1~~GHVU01234040.1.p1  ORF type:complete len:160 (+),score=21.97 GHVU01234040.1:56-481(+)
MPTDIEKDSVHAAYEDVRDDNTDTTWAVFKYEGLIISHNTSGVGFEEFQDKFDENERCFGFVRIKTGDELSKRVKFAFITWVGSQVSALKRAKMSTDKPLVKTIIQNFAVEIQTSEKDELSHEFIKSEVMKAGGANYGTGQ